MQNERIKTEEHIEYDSDDTPESGETFAMIRVILHIVKLQVTSIE